MKYVVIGGGGTGGVIGFKLSKAGKDVTLIARGAHLAAMQEKGLTISRLWEGIRETVPVKAAAMEAYAGSGEKPDVIFVCVKEYSLGSVSPFIAQVAVPGTVVIPVLNIFGTGKRLRGEFPGLSVMDGCIYVSANIASPGILAQHGAICRVVFGPEDGDIRNPRLSAIADDLRKSGIDGILSANIQRDCLMKFSYVSPIGAAGLYYGCTAGSFQREGEERELFKALMRDIVALAAAMGIFFEQDPVEVNLAILADIIPEATTSMQRDEMENKPSELDGLVFGVLRMAKEYRVTLPAYEKVAAVIGARKQADKGKVVGSGNG